jgi:hypothetical protein
MYYISEKNREGEPESKKSSSSRSIAAVLEKKLEDKGNFKLRELELREKELEVRKTEAENEKKRIEIMETMMRQQNDLIMTLLARQDKNEQPNNSNPNNFFQSFNPWMEQ